MKKLKFKKLDAFTNGTSTGNPAGYIDLTGETPLTETEMQRLAAELKGFVNEVGFVSQTEEGIHLRFYSSECEVAFCGHATIAILYDLLRNSPALAHLSQVNIRVKAGLLPVYNEIRRMDAVFIMAPAPQVFTCNLSTVQVAAALGCASAVIDDTAPIGLIDGGLRTLIVPLTGLEDILALHPDQEGLRLFCLAEGIDIMHVWVKETALPGSHYRTRVFAPKYGYLEDPATGSGNSAFGYYLVGEKRWQDDLVIEQGPNKSNPNIVRLKAMEVDGVLRILFGGNATTRIEGEYFLLG